MGAKPIVDPKKCCLTCQGEGGLMDPKKRKKIAVVTPEGQTLAQMNQAGLEAAEQQLKANPNLCKVDLQVTQWNSPNVVNGSWSQWDVMRGPVSELGYPAAPGWELGVPGS